MKGSLIRRELLHFRIKRLTKLNILKVLRIQNGIRKLLIQLNKIQQVQIKFKKTILKNKISMATIIKYKLQGLKVQLINLISRKNEFIIFNRLKRIDYLIIFQYINLNDIHRCS